LRENLRIVIIEAERGPNTALQHVISEDEKRIPAQLGNADWVILNVIGRKKRNGSEGGSSKPFLIQLTNGCGGQI
jgi:hypothetical protein